MQGYTKINRHVKREEKYYPFENIDLKELCVPQEYISTFLILSISVEMDDTPIIEKKEDDKEYM